MRQLMIEVCFCEFTVEFHGFVVVCSECLFLGIKCSQVIDGSVVPKLATPLMSFFVGTALFLVCEDVVIFAIFIVR